MFRGHRRAFHLAKFGVAWYPGYYTERHINRSASSLFRPRRLALVASGGVFLVSDASRMDVEMDKALVVSPL